MAGHSKRGRRLPDVDLPLDHVRAGGFDPRDFNLAVRFPPNTRSACFSCEKSDYGLIFVVVGRPVEVAEALEAAGFRLVRPEILT